MLLAASKFSHRRLYLCVVIAYALFISLITPLASAQAPLPAATPGGHPNIPAPLSAPSHPPATIVAPPKPAVQWDPRLLPSLGARSMPSPSPPGIPTIEPPNVVATASHLADPCGLDCGGADPPAGSGTDPDFSTARTRPQNETGASGVDLGSRNFNWSLPLVDLKGRAGLDLILRFITTRSCGRRKETRSVSIRTAAFRVRLRASP